MKTLFVGAARCAVLPARSSHIF